MMNKEKDIVKGKILKESLETSSTASNPVSPNVRVFKLPSQESKKIIRASQVSIETARK